MVKPSVLWELRGQTGKPVTCVLDPPNDGTCLLTVTMGEDQIVAERFRQESDALAHSTLLMNDFVVKGWTEIYRRDVRI